jgi:hypothetical protein
MQSIRGLRAGIHDGASLDIAQRRHMPAQSAAMCQEDQQEADHAMTLWHDAMSEQRIAEAELDAARRKRHVPTVQALSWKVDRLRYRADLLLASAVRALHDAAP